MRNIIIFVKYFIEQIGSSKIGMIFFFKQFSSLVDKKVCASQVNWWPLIYTQIIDIDLEPALFYGFMQRIKFQSESPDNRKRILFSLRGNNEKSILKRRQIFKAVLNGLLVEIMVWFLISQLRNIQSLKELGDLVNNLRV